MISRKLHRNAFGKHYLSVDAEAKARPRHFHCHPHKKWDAPVFHYSCSSKVIIFCRFVIFVIYIRIGCRLVS